VTNPFKDLPATNFWSQSVALAPLGGLDPVTTTRFTISADDKVATMGSCFAQHISRYLEQVGLTYFVAEDAPPSLPADEAERRGYRVFSARYGNVYTVRQARQLVQRAFGTFTASDDAWARGDRIVDAFRPQVEPNGFESVEAMRAARVEHLDAVRRVVCESDVLVFTLGLTESWMSTSDGAVYPVAPGVHGGDYEPDRYRFVNFSVGDVVDDLEGFVDDVRALNHDIRILLTVSPVPLIATYESRHVLVSNTLSKATLRIAAAEVVGRRPFVEYFPSYEIIAGSAAGTRYFEPDLRQVSRQGVDHVMRVFAAHLLQDATTGAGSSPVDLGPERSTAADVVCDEELIEAALRASGTADRRPG
jgi:hypothetical protein